MSIEKFWNEFLEFSNDKTLTYTDCFHFCLNKKDANELLDLVLSGKKKATSSGLLGYTNCNERIPQVGDLSIVTDFDNSPKCVIETVCVNIIPFNQITFDICKREGEDECLETWQKGHRNFFIQEGKALGYEFTEDMPVVFEDFKVIFSK